MEAVLNNGFCEMSQEEMMVTDGGLLFLGAAITLTTGAKIALGLFGAGVVIGGAWAFSD